VLHLILSIAVSLTLAQTPPPTTNTACAALTPAQVSSLIGAAYTLPVSASPNGSSCMFQNNDKMITVLMATVDTVDGAQGLFNAKKRIVAGTDVAGWGAPAYAGFMKPDVAVVGILLKQTLTEVKVIDATQKPEALGAKLQAVMKDVAARK
jgi:hypothetical protein